MLDVLKRLIIPLVAALGAAIALWHASYWLAGLCLAVVALGIYDWSQRTWTITRNFPVAGRLRWLFYQLRPYLRAYIVEDDLHGTPYSFDARNLIHARARGEIDTHPFGTERDVDQPDYHWIGHSIAPEPDPDTSPRVLVGNDQCSRPYSASVLNISAMSFGSLSANAIRALNLGAKLGGFYHDTGEGGVSQYHLEHGGDLVWELGSGYYGARDSKGQFDPGMFSDTAARDEIKMIEIKLSQGAKPGHGGMLPAAKVTDEIARIRAVPAHRDCLSPRGHPAFSTPLELMAFVAKLRELSGGKPVGFKLCIGQPHEPFALVKAMLETQIYPDFIVVDGGEGGTGAAPLELTDWVGMPLSEGLVLMRNALVGADVKDKVRLAASGKVYSGMGLARNMAMGADWCNAARAFMMSVGCIQAQRCHLGSCPTGVATQDAGRQRGLIPEVQGKRAALFHEKTVHALSDIAAAAGFKHPSDIQPHHLMHRTGPERALSMDRIHPMLPRGVLLEAPQDTLYGHWWQAAQADSFRPGIALVEARARAH
jgi:glutamate synthase domain-containing protein 2